MLSTLLVESWTRSEKLAPSPPPLYRRLRQQTLLQAAPGWASGRWRPSVLERPWGWRWPLTAAAWRKRRSRQRQTPRRRRRTTTTRRTTRRTSWRGWNPGLSPYHGLSDHASEGWVGTVADGARGGGVVRVRRRRANNSFFFSRNLSRVSFSNPIASACQDWVEAAKT